MTIETETILIKLLEELKLEVKETNRKLEKFIDTTNQKFDNIQKDLTDLKVGQARLEINEENLQKGQDAINAKLATQNTWLLSLLTALIIGILGLVAAVGRVVFFPNP